MVQGYKVQEVVRSAMAASSPGPNGVPYCVFKGAPDVLKSLEANRDCMGKRSNTGDVASGRWYFHSKREP